jgi:hypothetical protein
MRESNDGPIYQIPFESGSSAEGSASLTRPTRLTSHRGGEVNPEKVTQNFIDFQDHRLDFILSFMPRPE